MEARAVPGPLVTPTRPGLPEAPRRGPSSPRNRGRFFHTDPGKCPENVLPRMSDIRPPRAEKPPPVRTLPVARPLLPIKADQVVTLTRLGLSVVAIAEF